MENNPPVVTWSNLKQDFYLFTKNYNALILNDHYKSICKTLEHNIKEAKGSHFNKQICNSRNKIKTMWNVLKTVTGRKPINNNIHTLNIDGKIITNNKLISIYFNEHFLIAADKIINKMKNITHNDITCLVILSKHQYGFWLISSIWMAIYKPLNEISEASTRTKIMGGMFCDLRTAFNCVNHGILLSKLAFYGIKGSFLKLTISYLQDRYQKVQISAQNYYTLNSKDWRKISHGVWIHPWTLAISHLHEWSDCNIRKQFHFCSFHRWH